MSKNRSDIYAEFGNDHVARDLFIHLCLRACPIDGVTVLVGKKTVSLNRGDILFSATTYAKILRLKSRQAALNALTRLEVKYDKLDSIVDSIMDSKVDSKLDSKRSTNPTVVSLKKDIGNLGLDSKIDSKVDSILDSNVDSKNRINEYNARIVINNKNNNKTTNLKKTNKSLREENFSFPPELTEEEQKEFLAYVENRKAIKAPMTAHAIDLALKRYVALSPTPSLRLACIRKTITQNWKDFYQPDLTASTYWQAVAGLTPSERAAACSNTIFREFLQKNLPDEYQILFP